uniref:Uncharacterized protein n=1 Tax=Tanacetum cinerariifolium TaxID=118510 RepID=A0A6L2K313_TANCI|nr:hypothetical protein [Tanacetum cinerariifolium]
MRKTMLKQEFSEFSVSEEEGLHKGYDRFQKILSQLNQMQAKLDNDDVNIKFRRALPPSWSQVAFTLKTRGGLEYLSFDDLYKNLDHAGNAAGSVYNDVAEFAMMGISRKVQTCPFGCDSQLSYLKKNYDHLEKLYNDSFIQVQAYNTVKTLELQKDWYHTTQLALEEKVRILSANLENTTNTLKYSKTLYDQAKIEKKEWEVNSMSTKTKLGLGFKEYIGSDEVCDLFTPNVFDPEPENKEVKSLYERFVKAGRTHEVPPPITGTFMPTSYKSDLEETQATFGSKSNTSLINTSESNDFVSCNNSDKSSASETYDFAFCVSSPKTNDSFSTVEFKILPKSEVKDKQEKDKIRSKPDKNGKPIMSSSIVTYTSVYTDSEPWRFYVGFDEELSDVGVIVYGYDGLPMQLVAPPSPDYVPGPEHQPSPDYVPNPEHSPSLVYLPDPEYPEYLVLSEDEAPIEDQPLPADALPIALSTSYAVDSDLEENPEKDHANYPADGRDGDDEPSDEDDDDDANDEDEGAFEDEEDDE